MLFIKYLHSNQKWLDTTFVDSGNLLGFDDSPWSTFS